MWTHLENIFEASCCGPLQCGITHTEPPNGVVSKNWNLMKAADGQKSTATFGGTDQASNFELHLCPPHGISRVCVRIPAFQGQAQYGRHSVMASLTNPRVETGNKCT